jgi:1-acyl-sn-glycerol-3-phosphate acyltransferase
VLRAIKIVWLYAWAISATLAVFLPLMIASLITPSSNAAFELSRLWALVLIKAAGVRLTVRNRERIDPNQSYIIISNHQSHFDSLALVRTLGIPFRWVAKTELQRIPLFGHALRALGTVFIDRTNRESAIASIRRGVGQMPRGVSLIFFPEGTRSEDGAIGTFKKGGFITAIEAGWPILPVTVTGSRHVLPKGSPVFQSGPIDIVVGDPIETKDDAFGDIEALVMKTRSVIIENGRFK